MKNKVATDMHHYASEFHFKTASPFQNVQNVKQINAKSSIGDLHGIERRSFLRSWLFLYSSNLKPHQQIEPTFKLNDKKGD